MIGLMIGLLLGSSCLVSSISPADSLNNNRQALYEDGIPFDQFLADAESRKDRWSGNYEDAVVDDDLLARVKAVGGSWMFLAVAVDGCSDAVSTVPYVAKLVDQFDNIEMRVVDSAIGRQVMLDHPTPDGRAATPTIVILNEQFEEVGCFIERPQALQEWESATRASLSDEEYLKQKFALYDKDAGRQTLEVIVEQLELASKGQKGC